MLEIVEDMLNTILGENTKVVLVIMSDVKFL